MVQSDGCGMRSVAMAFSSDGCTLASRIVSGTIKVWVRTAAVTEFQQRASWSTKATIGSAVFSGGAISLSCDGRWLSIGDGMFIVVRDLDEEDVQNQEAIRLEGHTGVVSSIALSVDGGFLVSAGGLDKTVKAWTVNKARPKHTHAPSPVSLTRGSNRD